jgi:glycosyltransferase involved in cell wall biosynthesis
MNELYTNWRNSSNNSPRFLAAGLWYIGLMRLLFVADGRSPTTLSWLRYWVAGGHEIHLVSTFPCEMPPGLASLRLIPAAFGGMAGEGTAARRRGVVSRLRALLRPLRYVLGPLSLPPHQEQFRRLVDSLRPDLVHALRIPFEGMLACVTPPEIPLIISIWGNDLTLHARGSPLMAALTRRVLRRANGLLADTRRDIRLAGEWGLRADAPTLVAPGAGGIRLDEIAAGSRSAPLPEELPDAPLVVNPRGHRPGSLRQDVFFRAIPRVLERIPQAHFICPPLRGDLQAEGWVSALGIAACTRLWPKLEQAQLWALMRRAQVFVSPSVHDGTPNSLLEAMACGCLPVAGNIESMREWITDGVNGLLVDASDERALADAMARGLNDAALQSRAARMNAALVAERADYTRTMGRVSEFYESLIAKR